MEQVRILDEVLERARTCGVCSTVIPLAAVALVAREASTGRMRACACSHLYCRARLREDLLLSASDDDNEDHGIHVN